ncbi:hypothetical protein FOA43_003398 [Brettanomyces nanus]|uniref:Golgi apparatus membrane protein TVP23 n=1 Tax=Eeniella nana TaxID=13502 RepID=A0A875S7W3_EENNA|nr:uncharacterized protein FOA43_003398 [Brettanomyces nanus]QPG76012.1 hypothetical protein FOA43_003398 [Brettanomyces nanus]
MSPFTGVSDTYLQPDVIKANTPVPTTDTPILADTSIQGSMPTATNSQSQNESMTTTLYRKLAESAHPVALLFYLILRVFPVVIYLCGLWFTSNYILFFIVVILLLAADFWNLKNISGRLLVGLRWWNETNDVGQSVLVFETADPNRHINPIDSKVFWMLLYLCPVIWMTLGFMALVKLEFVSLILVGIAIALSATNTMAYTKCDKFGKANSIANDVFGSVTGSLFERLNPLKLFTRAGN